MMAGLARVEAEERVGGSAAEGMLEFAARFFAAVERGELEAVRASYAPGAVIWHNHDGATQTVDENLGVLAWVAKSIAGFRYEDVRRVATTDGFVEQHVIRGRAPNGDELHVPACIVCTVEQGLITRLDEYLDSAQIAALRTPG
jgi:ketosteroid isomerase-like protein